MGVKTLPAENYSHSHIDGLMIATARVLAGLETPGGQTGLRGNTPRGHGEPGGGDQGGEGEGGVILVSDHGPPAQQAQGGVTSQQHGHRPHHHQIELATVVFHITSMSSSLLVFHMITKSVYLT